MSFLVLQSSTGLQKHGDGVYQAVTDDPHFAYWFWVRRPRYMLVVLQAFDGTLDPRLYADRGNGFDEAGSIALDHHASTCIYCIKVTPPYQVRRLRIDPCSSEARFRFWAKWAWSREELANLLSKAKLEAGHESTVSRVSVYDVVVDGKPEKHCHQDLNKNIAKHFDAVVAQARSTAPPIDQSLTKDGPFISFVVPVYNAPENHLDELLASLREQPVGAAELILCDDGSTAARTRSWLDSHRGDPDLRIVDSKQNRGIAAATNAGIEMARGAWVGLVDHDDALTPGTVQLIAQTVRENPNCRFIYTDEVITDERLKPVAYHLKPAYDEVLLSGVNYINHLSCYRREQLCALGGLRSGFEGSQDYDLLLRYLRDLKPQDIKHLPYPAYRWRRSQGAFSAQFMDRATQSARNALAERYGLTTNVETAAIVDEAITKTLHRVRFDHMQKRWPRVSVVIPSRNAFPLISRVLADLTTRTEYPDFEIIVVDNGSTDPRVLQLYAEYEVGSVPFRCDIEAAPFNFSHQVNRGVALATGELILLLNNDIEVLDRDWLREMVSCFAYPNTGIVGARLLYPNRRIQHAGVIVGLGGLAGHWFDGQRESNPGPMARLHVRQSLTAVTGACMLMSRACLERVGKFDATDFAIAYNDVDFCLRAVANGYRVVWTPFATLIHYESASRGSDETKANRERFTRDKAALQRHGTERYEDRAFSPWYTRDRAVPSPVMLDRLPIAR